MNWKFVYGEMHSLILNDAFFTGFTQHLSAPGMLKTILYINEQGWQTCYTTPAELKRVKQEGIRFLKESYRQEFSTALDKKYQKFVALYRRFKKIQLKTLSNVSLLKLFEQYIHCLQELFSYYQVGGGRSYPLLEKKIRGQLKSTTDDVQSTLALLLKDTRLDSVEKEELNLLKIVEKRKDTDTNLLQHTKKYSGRFFNVFEKNDVLIPLKKRIKELKGQGVTLQKKREGLQSKKQKTRRQQKAIEDKLNTSTISAIRYLRRQSTLRLQYKDMKNGCEYRFLELFDEIAKRAGMSTREFLFSYKISDVRGFLNGKKKISQKEVKKRLEFFVFLQQKNSKKFLSGAAAKSFAEKLLKIRKQSTLKGVCASKGHAIGRAHVVLFKDAKQMLRSCKEFGPGEILVTTMTQPEMVPLIAKAAAIVTDQGGITSHAAVIAREYGVPCVIATGNASKSIKTGAQLLVDATKGIVKVL